MRISFDVPEAILHSLLDSVPLPRVARFKYTQPTAPGLEDVGSRVRDALGAARIASMVSPGQRIAIAVGSRGIAFLPEIVAVIVAELRACGARPFIVPAMGSHGGARAAGQREVLEHLGVTPDAVGAPIESSMETVVLGRTADGTPVHLDRQASQADGIVLVARIKPHTAFRGLYESGLAKMLAIGLGKQMGAATTHARGFGELARVVPEMAAVALDRAPIRLAVAVLENAHDLPFKVVAVPAERMLAEEPALLDEARAAMPRIPFDRFDVLVIDRIGKNISGDGADPNVTGRYPTPFASGGPDVNKQVVLDLAEASAGNANGVGTGDFTTVRLARKMSFAATYPNALTSTIAGPVKLPMVLPSDELAIKAALLTCNATGREPRLVRIGDTLHLDRLLVSEAMLPEAGHIPTLELLQGPAPIEFDRDGNLPDLVSDRMVTNIAVGAETDAW